MGFFLLFFGLNFILSATQPVPLCTNPNISPLQPCFDVTHINITTVTNTTLPTTRYMTGQKVSAEVVLTARNQRTIDVASKKQ